MALRELYPAIEPFKTEQFKVDETHVLYLEQSGNEKGVPVIFLQENAGGVTPSHRQFFDAAKYRIILFEQRGSGRSTPRGETRNNTLKHSLADLEAIRLHLSIEKWHIFGGSWGSTLALYYAAAHPERCLSLTLQAVNLLTNREVDWFFNGMRAVFPEAWDAFASIIPETERKDLLHAYSKRLNDERVGVLMEAARAWARYEASCTCMVPNQDIISAMNEENKAVCHARLGAHYMTTQAHAKSPIFNAIDRIRAIPSTLIQGRYDMVCPIITADELHRAWPEANYVVVPDAGHSAFEPGIRSALLDATDKFATIS